MLQARKNIRNKKRNKNKKKYKAEGSSGAGFGAYQKPKVENFASFAMRNVTLFSLKLERE